MVRHLLRPAHGAEKDGVVAADLLLPIVRHHLAVAGVVIAAREIESVITQIDAELTRRRVQYADSFRNYFAADAVARDDGDPMGLHVF